MSTADTFAALYRELVLEHGRAPRHGGELEAPSHRAEASNPLCGDRIVLTLQLDGDGRIARLQHRTEGCLLCTASASLMACDVPGRDADGIGARLAALRAGVSTGEAAGLDDLGALAGVSAHPARHRCVLLPWEALVSALSEAPR
ncbi:Fe-S cluster assembly sulfur transfer protein SufU [Arenimonas terrae]|uniref:SUF system NifU family Fe-S cluster assembly protein n=1 Tax=Arenimonas terrae TaxID=2546226 RepID=A0A5C4RSJ8_9GAMM|nr:SUF system NifU family Fe-S cluster assembly protein [Arenimonas terrae]TNJ33949.1 SUF system NifU family Fe-S cluster assembly protein [Arenimonas terrae]